MPLGQLLRGKLPLLPEFCRAHEASTNESQAACQGHLCRSSLSSALSALGVMHRRVLYPPQQPGLLQMASTHQEFDQILFACEEASLATMVASSPTA